VKYLLDEDATPEVAVIARNLGLDAVSVHEIGRRALPDEEQFAFAATEGRILVTRNRNDFIELVASAFAAGRPCPGVLVVSRSISASPPSLVAHALSRWHARCQETGSPGECFCGFLS
jgi:predicted nuclease of predicted toxin-antitoxin system